MKVKLDENLTIARRVGAWCRALILASCSSDRAAKAGKQSHQVIERVNETRATREREERNSQFDI